MVGPLSGPGNPETTCSMTSDSRRFSRDQREHQDEQYPEPDPVDQRMSREVARVICEIMFNSDDLKRIILVCDVCWLSSSGFNDLHQFAEQIPAQNNPALPVGLGPRVHLLPGKAEFQPIASPFQSEIGPGTTQPDL